MPPAAQEMLFLSRSLSSPSFPLFQLVVLEKNPVTRVMPSTSGEAQNGQVDRSPRVVLPQFRQAVNSGLNETASSGCSRTSS